MTFSIGFFEYTIRVLKLNESFRKKYLYVNQLSLSKRCEALVHLGTTSSLRKMSLWQTISFPRPATMKLVHNQSQYNVEQYKLQALIKFPN